MYELLLLSGVLCALLALGIVESLLHRRHLARIPIRIHVNGTRGKSSVTRLIAAGLRAGGLRTCAKTTGTLPRFIHTDGAEEPIARLGRPNIIEQVEIVRKAVEEQADVLVVECMALHPLLQSLSESHLVKSTHGVITNARPDHLDVMGPSPHDVAKALAGTTPQQGTLYTGESVHLPILHEAAADRHSRLVAVSNQAEDVTDHELRGFSYLEHPDNVAVALAVCADLGVTRETALRGMWNATPDPGALTSCEVVTPGRRVVFVNGFAANDPSSTAHNWRLATRSHPFAEARIAVVNCRTDRPDRSVQMAEMISGWSDVDRIFAIGSGTDVFSQAAGARGVNGMRLIRAEGWLAERIADEIALVPGSSLLVMGMGNIAGVGLELAATFRNRAAVTIPAQPTHELQKAA